MALSFNGQDTRLLSAESRFDSEWGLQFASARIYKSCDGIRKLFGHKRRRNYRACKSYAEKFEPFV